MKLEPDEWEKDHDPRGTWLVQTGELGSGKGNDYGVVSDGHGFEDSPDCERISGGVNSKGPYAVAIGRQANLLQWGFYAAPDRMTESARRTFRNAIVYMKRFDGARPLVKKAARSRSWYVQYVDAVRRLPTMKESSRKSYEKYLRGRFPAEVTKDGLDADRLQAWLRANLEYIYCPERFEYAVDQDLAKLRLSNRKLELLDWLSKRLSEAPEDPLALKLAGRYLGRSGADAGTTVSWIRKNRDRCFFSDVGGYRWFVDPGVKESAGASTGEGSRNR